jgi:hypothetical protein
VARASAEQALSFVLLWYQGISLDQLEHHREDDLSGVDLVKLRQRAYAIAQCANTDSLFDTWEGDSDEAIDVWTSKCLASWRRLRRQPRTLPAVPFHHPPVVKISCWRRGPLIAPLSSQLMPRLTLSYVGDLYHCLFVC